MKILVICQYYYPEPFRLHDLCEEMVRRGHEVCVVTGEPNYPEGTIYPGYEQHRRADEMIGGVQIHRCPIVPRKSGVFFRMLNYFSFPLSAKRYLKKRYARSAEAFDVVFINQLSPVMMAQPAIAFKKKHHIPLVMYCLDLWPVSLTAGGISKASALYLAFYALSGRIYRAMDRILVTSRMFSGYLENEFSVKAEKIAYLPQYAERLFDDVPQHEPSGETVFLFAGNIGAVQSIDTILAAAERLKDEPVHIDIVGGGTDLERLERLAAEKKLDNVTFFGRRPVEEMPSFYARADAMLVTLRADEALSMTLPGKVQSYMAAGKPVIGAINGETAKVIADAGCGFCGAAEDAAALAENMLRFAGSDQKVQMGAWARLWYEEHFSQRRFMDELERELLEAAQQGREPQHG